MNKEMLSWNGVKEKGLPEKTGSYFAIIDDGSFGMKEPQITFFFKKGTHLLLLPDDDDYNAADADVFVRKDGFYKLTSDWREHYLRQLPVLYWLELPALPEEYVSCKMKQAKEIMEEMKEEERIVSEYLSS